MWPVKQLKTLDANRGVLAAGPAEGTVNSAKKVLSEENVVIDTTI